MTSALEGGPGNSRAPQLSPARARRGSASRLFVKNLLLRLRDITYTDHTGKTMPRAVFDHTSA
jgi:hypothetical protein